jgi:succinate dehydrogenase / fumarate reductase membrane anchor subunit
MNESNKLRSALSRARGLGSAKDGTDHWVWQRLTALAIAPLSLWFMASLMLRMQVGSLEAVQHWLSAPLNAILSIALFSALFYHARLGLQVIVEDYIHCPVVKFIALIKIQLLYLLAAIATIVAIGYLHFMG